MAKSSTVRALARVRKGKRRGNFDESKHPRDEKGRWAVSTIHTGWKREGERTYNGKQILTPGKRFSKWETGRLGEEIAKKWLKSIGTPAIELNTKKKNAPIDLLTSKDLVEVKCGLVSTGNKSARWRVSLGEPAPSEKAMLKKMSKAKKKKWNLDKDEKAMMRKNEVWRAARKQFQKPLGKLTVAIIANPHTKMADIYVYKGFHKYVGWNGKGKDGLQPTKNYYRTTIRWA